MFTRSKITQLDSRVVSVISLVSDGLKRTSVKHIYGFLSKPNQVNLCLLLICQIYDIDIKSCLSAKQAQFNMYV